MMHTSLRASAPLQSLLSWLPQSPPAVALCLVLDRVVLPALDADTLASLSGRHFLIEVTDLGLRLRFTLAATGFAIDRDGCEPDLRIAAHSTDLVRLAAREVDADTLFFSRRLVMQGSTELGLIVRNAVDAIDLQSQAGGRPLALALSAAARVAAFAERTFARDAG